jgi:hypothetical protein
MRWNGWGWNGGGRSGFSGGRIVRGVFGEILFHAVEALEQLGKALEDGDGA